MFIRMVLCCAGIALASDVVFGQAIAPYGADPPHVFPTAALGQAARFDPPAPPNQPPVILTGASEWQVAMAGPAQPCAVAPPICWDCCRLPCCECPEPPAPCLPCPRINTVNPSWNVLIGGAVVLDMLGNTARPVAPGTPFLLAPESVNNEDTFDMHGRQTALFAALSGPEIGNFKAGGLLVANLYDNSVIDDIYGFLPYQAYGELKNDYWRFAAGLQMDIFAPVLPTVLPFSYLMTSGNAGVFRGQLRAERFIHHSDNSQITITGGISEPTPTIINNSRLLGGLKIVEDNGWPNLEMRLAWSVGHPEQVGLEAKRPFEIGFSSVAGQMRITTPPDQYEVDVFGVAADFRWRVSDLWGFAGEVFTGQGLGTYGGAIFQSTNSLAPFEAVHATGGWGEVYVYLTPCLHTHVGMGVDNPLDGDLFITQIARNETFFANLIWDVTKSFRLATEITYRQTDYMIPALDNQGVGIHGQVMFKF